MRVHIVEMLFHLKIRRGHQSAACMTEELISDQKGIQGWKVIHLNLWCATWVCLVHVTSVINETSIIPGKVPHPDLCGTAVLSVCLYVCALGVMVMSILVIQIQAAVLMSFQEPSQSCIPKNWFLFALLRVCATSNTDGICCLLYPAAAAVASFCPPVCLHLLIETDKSLNGAFFLSQFRVEPISHISFCPALTLSPNITNPQQL